MAENIRKAPSGKWRAEIRDGSGKKVSRSFARKADARAWRVSQLASVRNDDYVDPNKGKVKFGDWADGWLNSAHHLAESTKARYEIAIRQDLNPVFGARNLSQVTYEDVQALVDALVKSGKAPATVRKTFNVLSAIMGAAVRAGRIRHSPCRGVQLPQTHKREMRHLEAHQVDKLAATAGERWTALILLTAYTGLRWSEVVALRPADVDLVHRRITIQHAAVEVRGHFDFKTPKSGEAQSVLLPAYVADELARHMERYPSPDHVFTAVEGGPLRQTWKRRVFVPAVEASGLAPLRFHDLRHTSVALAIQAGAHPKVVQARARHSSIRTTLDTYGHLLPSLDEGVAEALDLTARAASMPPDDDEPPLEETA